MNIIKRIELPNGMNLSVIEFDKVTTLELNRLINRKITVKRFIVGLEIDGEVYFSEEKEYRDSLEDCTWDILNHLSYYNNNVDLTKFYPQLYLFQKSFKFSEMKKELKTRFQNWLAKDSLS